MENEKATELRQIVKQMNMNRRPVPAGIDMGDTLFSVHVRLLGNEEAGDGYSGGMDMKVMASPDLLRDDVMGRRLRAALRLSLDAYLADHPAENDNVNQTIELDG